MSALRFTLGLFGSSLVLACSHAPPAPAVRSPARAPISADRPPHKHPAGHKGPCNAKYKGRCFASPDDACAAAGCADQRCDVLDSVPPRVSCDDLR